MLVDMNALYFQAANIVKKEKPTQQEMSDAFDILTALQNMNPKNPLVLYTMGTLAAKRSQNALAILLLEVCLQIAEDNYLVAITLLNLGLAHRKEERYTQALHCYNTALDMLKNAPEGKEKEFDGVTCDIMSNISGLYVAAGNPDRGLEIIKEIEERWPDYEDMPRLMGNKSLMLLEKGEYAAGFDEMDNAGGGKRPVNKNYYGDPPLWDGTKGATVVVTGEQGIGDEIMFASMIPDLLKDCNVVMDSHMRLADMFRRSFGCPVYATREFSTLMWRPPEMPYYKIPIGSLGRFYRRSKEAFPGTPYLKTDSKLSVTLKEKLDALGTKPKIGISWRGGSKMTNKSARYIPLEAFLPIFKTVDAEWISLQYHQMSQKEVDIIKEKYGVTIHHWQDVMDDYDMTASLVENLDLVVSVPQSVVHLAGALGKETIQLCPKMSMWQAGPYGEDAPWYRSVKNIWQPEFGDWEGVLKTLEAQLCSLYPKNTDS
jgi:tetratricopeptide (TPR) repeat protein